METVEHGDLLKVVSAAGLEPALPPVNLNLIRYPCGALPFRHALEIENGDSGQNCTGCVIFVHIFHPSQDS
jgi:hypothetical protein